MEEKNKEQLNTFENDAFKKMAENLIKDEDLDFSSIFKMANNLLKDDSLMELVEEIGKTSMQAEDNAEVELSNEGGNSQESELEALKKDIAALKAELKNTNREVAELKIENASLLRLYLKVFNAANNDFKKSVSLITGLSKLLK